MKKLRVAEIFIVLTDNPHDSLVCRDSKESYTVARVEDFDNPEDTWYSIWKGYGHYHDMMRGGMRYLGETMEEVEKNLAKET